MSAAAYLDLPVDAIDANPDQPRKSFDPAKLQELAESIAANGLLEPVIVRPVDGRYLLIAGERRWRASKTAGLATIPARVIDVGEIEAYILSVAENVNRDDMTAMEEARAFDQLRRYGKDDREIARVFGKRVDVVRDRMNLLNLIPEAQAMIDAGTMAITLGWYVTRLRPGNQRVVVNRLARGELSHPEAVDFSQALLDGEGDVSMFAVEEPTEEERIAHQKAARKAANLVDQIERLSALLGDLAVTEPEALAAALGNDVGVRLRSVERIARQVKGATITLRKAKAVSEARSLAVREEG